MSERLQKYLADMGIASRREIERWIEAGRIIVDGQKAELGTKVSDHSKIKIDGEFIRKNPHQATAFPKVLMYYKPEGLVCTMDDPEGRKTVFERLPRLRQGRWIMIGRLDINTMGLLLFTTHGELAHRLMHPRYEIEREYAVRTRGEVTPAMLTKLRTGVELEDGMAKFDTVTHQGGDGLNHWYHVTLKEGRNREVRRLWESQEITVSRLIRLRYGNVALPREVSRGRWEHLTKLQVHKLADLVELDFRQNK